jgi:hypothetical protein
VAAALETSATQQLPQAPTLLGGEVQALLLAQVYPSEGAKGFHLLEALEELALLLLAGLHRRSFRGQPRPQEQVQLVAEALPLELGEGEAGAVAGA